ncbi:hypothetical protein D4740_00585 [Actinomyces sp. 2119]|uniref:hypothetical protein n=1 Tax=Actinomyces sp. 2119 TaxID=2321393 RepID=UPI000E6C94D2|nr:hypothetical protein [Actinomyces sp. 2119]RJF44719.1 hypothetical protein D4740_00585 [Actinomyces sp. 2119]
MRLQEEADGDGNTDARSFSIEGTMERAAEPTPTGEPAEPVPPTEDEEAAEPAQPDQEVQSPQSPLPADSPAGSLGPDDPADSATPREPAALAEAADTAQAGPTDPPGPEEPEAAGPGQPSASEEVGAGAQPESSDPSVPAPAAEERTRSDESQGDGADDGVDEVSRGVAEDAGTGAESGTPVLTAPPTATGLPDSGSESDLDQSGRGGGEDSSQVRDGSGPSSDSPEASVDARERPSFDPVPPVSDTSQLSADNAGALSGTRRGDAVVLMIPRDRASAGEWVSVFVLSDSTRSLSVSDNTSSGWIQIDSSNSVTVDISGLRTGTYRLVVADSGNNLLGWAQLEIQAGSSGSDGSEVAYVIPGEAAVGQTLRVGPEDWMLLGAGMLLVLGTAGFLVVARPGVLRSVARAASELGRRR